MNRLTKIREAFCNASLETSALSKAVVMLMIVFISSLDMVGQERIYFDSLWNKTVKENAKFYRTVDTIHKELFMIRDYYISGEIQMLGHYSSMKKEEHEGRFIWYHKNGKKKSETFYKANLPQGTSYSWYNTGSLESSGGFSSGKRDGYWISFYKNGNTKTETYFKDDRNEKYFKNYYENGKLSNYIEVKNNIPDGDVKFYYPNGRMMTEGVIEKRQPKGAFIVRDSVTNQKIIINFLDRKYNMDLTAYHYNGKLMFNLKYKKGIVSSKVEVWFPNGVLYVSGEVKKGYKIGRWVTYDVKGNMEKIEYFKRRDKVKYEPGVDPLAIFGALIKR